MNKKEVRLLKKAIQAKRLGTDCQAYKEALAKYNLAMSARRNKAEVAA